MESKINYQQMQLHLASNPSEGVEVIEKVIVSTFLKF
jgi:hypothetical protein